MSRPASSERPRSSGRTHTDEEWERVKQQFYYYYMERNMSLKEAARHMSESHGFDATLRQWERRIAPEKWAFSKYASRDERLKQIDAAGKSLLDVSQRGRRRSTASDGRPSLLEDRNLRRFARREVSRESRRSRAKSVSGLSDPSDQEMDDASSAAPSPAPSEQNLDLKDVSSFSQLDFVPFQDPWAAHSTQDSTKSIPQIHVFDDSQNLAVPQINISAPDESYIAPSHIPMSMQAQVNVHYPSEEHNEVFNQFHGQMPEHYGGVQLQPQDFNASNMAHHVESSMNWDTSLPSNQGNSQSFGHFAFDNNNSVSFTDMLQLGSQDSQNAMTNQPESVHYASQSANSQEEIKETSDSYELNADFEDPTYVDVFAVLEEKDRKIMQMINMLKQSYQHSTSAEPTQRHVINSIALLEKGIQAQNHESEQEVRRTLKNISSTKNRAAQYIYERSTQRKRKIEQLEARINELSANQRHDFAYGIGSYKDSPPSGFSPTRGIERALDEARKSEVNGGRFDSFKSRIEGFLNQEILWWPLSEPMREGQRGMIQKYCQERNNSGASTAGTTFTTSQNSPSSSHLARSSPEKVSRPQLSSELCRSTSTTAISPTIARPVSQGLNDSYIYLCINVGPDAPRVFEMKATGMTEDKFISTTIKTYYEANRWRSLWTMTELGRIRFHRFTRLSDKHDHVSISVRGPTNSALPPPTDKEWSVDDRTVDPSCSEAIISHHLQRHYKSDQLVLIPFFGPWLSDRLRHTCHDVLLPLVPRKSPYPMIRDAYVEGYGMLTIPQLALWRIVATMLVYLVIGLVYAALRLLRTPYDMSDAFTPWTVLAGTFVLHFQVVKDAARYGQGKVV